MHGEMAQAGLSALYLFGSQARLTADAGSDIDLAFDVRPDARFSLIDQAKLQLRLEEKLGRKVDLVERKALRPRIRQRIEAEMVRLL